MHILSYFTAVSVLACIGFLLVFFGKSDPPPSIKDLPYQQYARNKSEELAVYDEGETSVAEYSVIGNSLHQDFFENCKSRFPQVAPDETLMKKISRNLMHDVNRWLPSISRRALPGVSRRMHCKERVFSANWIGKNFVQDVDIEICADALKSGLYGSIFEGRLHCRKSREDCESTFNTQTDGSSHWSKIAIKINSRKAANGELDLEVDNNVADPAIVKKKRAKVYMKDEKEALDLLGHTLYNAGYGLVRVPEELKLMHDLDQIGLVMEFVDGVRLAENVDKLFNAPDVDKMKLASCLGAQSIIMHAIEFSRFAFNPDRHSGNAIVLNESISINILGQTFSCPRLVFIDLGLNRSSCDQNNLLVNIRLFLTRAFRFPFYTKDQTHMVKHVSQVSDSLVSIVAVILYHLAGASADLHAKIIRIVDDLSLNKKNFANQIELEALARVRLKLEIYRRQQVHATFSPFRV